MLRRVLTEFTADPQFLQQQGGRGKLLRTRLRLVTALRGQGKFDEANSILDELLKQKPPYLETLFEKGMLLESEAAAGKGTWSAALAPLGRPDQEDGADAPAAGELLTTPGITWRGCSTSKKSQPRPSKRSWA